MPAAASARRIGSNAVDGPGRADRTHRVAHEGIQACVVLVDLEIPGSVLHQHLVLARGAELTEADDVKVAADRANQVPLSELVEGW